MLRSTPARKRARPAWWMTRRSPTERLKPLMLGQHRDDEHERFVAPQSLRAAHACDHVGDCFRRSCKRCRRGPHARNCRAERSGLRSQLSAYRSRKQSFQAEDQHLLKLNLSIYNQCHTTASRSRSRHSVLAWTDKSDFHYTRVGYFTARFWFRLCPDDGNETVYRPFMRSGF